MSGQVLRKSILALFFQLSFLLQAQSIKVLTNQVGYEGSKAKRAIVIADQQLSIPDFQLVNTETGKVAYSGKTAFSGPVNTWKNWRFWTIDFSPYTTEGKYRVQVTASGKPISSYPFVIGKNVLEQQTLSDVIYYFKGQRSSGLLDKADHHLTLAGRPADTLDVHGGWYDATGDYGKHLSHLTFSSYFNPQQISLTAWSLFKTHEHLLKRPGTDFRQYLRRLLDEAMYGADYLVRVQAKDGSFYRSVKAPGPGKLAKDRVIQAEDKAYRIKQTKDQTLTSAADETNWRSYQVSYRSGGGVAIAALAMASTYANDRVGDYSPTAYLKAAESAFAFLEKNNVAMTNDGKENIVDDYCALSAATELYKATKKDVYKQAADKRAQQLVNRLATWKNYRDYWRADDQDRPFFHPSDAGLPLVSLLYYYPLASTEKQKDIKETVRRSMTYEMAVTNEVNNPFGYSRQLVQDTLGSRRTTFFFPHGSEASPWWQGENARLGSMATAARLAATLFTDDKPMRDRLDRFALDQLNWILGLNPYDASMLQGAGHNNPAYGFFGTFEYTNAPGGIVNGITSGIANEDDIDFNLSYKMTGKDADWRWAEQWLPHAAWYMMAVMLNE
ncbi:glycoside hydrolase family 9 protein [Spirosoma oryzicola]|uniref:glycoside hydrolase family 9 protein n=1 Tax=Spirosoma oryzicola TaxID=2898794 RepID=UPI001E5F4A84|nr:glycoside hydrolase family 9 protein [Spirosoma oryzicola]UHG89828.1 glycoside hydrolase family 9 protein [Spirosoma oryzicola]